jgi:hypothetical protein
VSENKYTIVWKKMSDCVGYPEHDFDWYYCAEKIDILNLTEDEIYTIPGWYFSEPFDYKALALHGILSKWFGPYDTADIAKEKANEWYNNKIVENA